MESFLLALVVITAPSRTLTLDEAVAVAQAHQPQLAAAHAQTVAGDNQASFYFTQLLPQINGNAQYSRSTSNFVQSPGALPRPLNPNTPTPSLSSSANYFSFALNANQLIYDFGQLYYTYTSAQATALSLAATERAMLLNVTLTVRLAYFNARLQKALLKVAHDTLDNQTRHRTQIEAFVQVGKRPEIDLLQARTDYSTAHLQAINADANYLLAKAQLNQSMGLEGDIDYDVGDDSLPAQTYEDEGIDALLDDALGHRPDYLSVEKQVLAQKLALRSAMGAWGPTFTATAGVSDAGEALNLLAWNWKAGVNVNWSIFGSGETYFTVEQNRWQLAALDAQQEITRQQVRLDVEQARLSVASAKEGIGAANDALENARQLLALAEGRYAAGIGNIIELGDAQLAYSTSAGNQVQSEFKLASARANLEKALGRL